MALHHLKKDTKAGERATFDISFLKVNFDMGTFIERGSEPEDTRWPDDGFGMTHLGAYCGWAALLDSGATTPLGPLIRSTTVRVRKS
jgi:hypothetical protein